MQDSSVTMPAAPLERWLEDNQSQSVEVASLLSDADDHMTSYDSAMQALEDARLRAAKEADDDGFVTVQPRKGKKGSAEKTQEELDPGHRGKGRIKKKKKEMLTNFYS